MSLSDDGAALLLRSSASVLKALVDLLSRSTTHIDSAIKAIHTISGKIGLVTVIVMVHTLGMVSSNDTACRLADLVEVFSASGWNSE